MAERKRRPWTRLARDEKGGIAIMAALAVFPLTALAFAAVEFHRYVDVREGLQDAVDAATFAVARSTETDPAKLNELGMAVLRGAFVGTDYVVTSASFVNAQGDVTGNASVKIPPVVSSLFGITELSASASSKASRLGRKLEVSLVLDNTYSMLTNDRIGLTKTAATAFVDKLSAAATRSGVADALKISLVPYSTTVNIGSQYRAAQWMDGWAKSVEYDGLFDAAVNRFNLFDQMGVAWAGCVESRPYPYDVDDTAPILAVPESLFVPYFAPDEPDPSLWDYTNNYIPDDKAGGWFERQQSTTKYTQAPTTTADIGSGYSFGPNYSCALQPVVRLTTDYEAVKAGIAAMRPTGDTYTNVGLMWGWHTLSPYAPFADGVPYSQTVAGTEPGEVQKIVVLMTDGENASWDNGSPNASLYSGGGYITQGRFGITGGTEEDRRAALDARMSEVCTNMKAKGVVIYAIRVEVELGAGDVLRNCATAPDKFFNVSAAGDLSDVFNKIADSLLNLRIAS